MERKDLPLMRVILLDRVQKKLPITNEGVRILRKEGLIEGRKPNYFVAAKVAAATDEKAAYIKNKAFDKLYYKQLIIEFLTRYHKASRIDIDNLLMDKLSNVLSGEQKRTKIRNLLYEMSKKDRSITNQSPSTANPKWVLADDKIR